MSNSLPSNMLWGTFAGVSVWRRQGFLEFHPECHAFPLADFGIRCRQLFGILISAKPASIFACWCVGIINMQS